MSKKSLELRLDNAEKELAEIRKGLADLRNSKTCVVDGTVYLGVSGPVDCRGCAGEGNTDVCMSLGDCSVPRVIWVAVNDC
jgi:hypothetical protein